MKLGFGLYRHQLDDEHFRFARQCGATHLVVHYVDYFNQADADTPAVTQPTGGLNGWGRAGDPDKLWSAEELIALRERVEAAGLILHAIENLDPAHWHDVLLAGPKRAAQLENVKAIIRNMGCAGIPVLGYNFSLADKRGSSPERVPRAWDFKATSTRRQFQREWSGTCGMRKMPRRAICPTAAMKISGSGSGYFSTPFCRWPRRPG